MDQTHGSAGVDFRAKILDERVYGVVFDIAIEAPHRFNDGGTGNRAAGAAQQELEQPELSAR